MAIQNPDDSHRVGVLRKICLADDDLMLLRAVLSWRRRALYSGKVSTNFVKGVFASGEFHRVDTRA